MKKEAAADEEGEGEVDALATGAGSPGWLELLSRQGVRVLLVLLLLVVTAVIGASATSLSASPIKPWVC